MFKHKNLLLLGSLGLIFLAIALVAILNRFSPSSETGDVRARAAITSVLQLQGTVRSTDPTAGTLILDNVYMAEESRSGDAKSLGSWIVTAPSGFNLASASSGQQVVIGIDSKTLIAESRTVTAVSIELAK
jgi:hypothetical protein